MNITMQNVKKSWKEQGIGGIKVEISVPKLSYSSNWRFDSCTKFIANLNTLGRFCSHIPQKVLEQYKTHIDVIFTIVFKDGEIQVKHNIQNIEDIELCFKNIEDDMMERFGKEIVETKKEIVETKKEELSQDDFFFDLF